MNSRRRLPPGQRAIESIIEIDLGVNPPFDPATWTLAVTGLVAMPITYTWTGFLELPQSEIVSDFHCVEGWSVLDQRWKGVLCRDLFEIVQPSSHARFAYLTCADGYSTNLPLEAMLADDVMLAHTHNGEPISSQDGGPVRLVISSRYAYKCAKWVRAIELLAEDRPGYWEVRGYHNNADVWRGERRG